MFFTSPEAFNRLEPFEGIRILACSGERMTVSVLTFEAQSEIPSHTHPHEQVGMVLEGELFFKIADEERTLRAGDVYLMPPNVEHSVRAPVASKVMDVFSPRRTEYA